jgi:hypothetical protein
LLKDGLPCWFDADRGVQRLYVVERRLVRLEASRSAV